MNSTQSRYPWQLYPLNAEALVWAHPIVIGDNTELREMASECLYGWARLSVSDEPLIELQRRAQRSAYEGLLAFMSGYTGGSAGPVAR